MACIDSRAELHIKEDSIITIIAIEDAITDIIALLALVLLYSLTEFETKKQWMEGCAVCDLCLHYAGAAGVNS